MTSASNHPEQASAPDAGDPARLNRVQIANDAFSVDGADPFAAAVGATRMPMVISDERLPDAPVVFVNDAFCRMTGYPREQIVGRNCRFMQGPDTDPAAVARIRKAIAGAEPLEIDIRNYRRDGTAFWNRLLISPVRDQAGKLAFYIASQVDVSLDRRRLTGLENDNEALIAELGDRLRAQADSEAQLELATQAGHLGIWELDFATGRLTASATAKANFGRDPAAGMTYADLLAQIHPDDRARMVETTVNAQRADGNDLDYRVLRPDGSVRWLQIRAQLLRDDHGAPLRLSGVSLDVTARREAEQRLEISEESLRLATEAAELGTWDLDIGNDVLTWSDRTKAMFGIDPATICTMADFYAGLHPDDSDMVAAAFAHAIDPAVRAKYDVEYRTVGRQDGVIRCLAAKGHALFDGHGNCVRAIGTVMDITQRRAEARRQAFLLDLLDRLRAMTDPREIMQVAIGSLGAHLGVSWAGFGHVGDDGVRAHLDNSYSGAEAGLSRATRLDMHAAGVIEDLRRGAICACADVAELDDAVQDLWHGLETKAFVAVPLLREERLSAFLYVGHRVARPWSPLEVALLGDVAARIWDGVARVQAEAAVRDAYASLERKVAERTAALQSSEARTRAVFKTSFQMQGLLAPDGTLLDANPTSLAVAEVGAEEVIGRKFWDTAWFTDTPGMPGLVRGFIRQAVAGMEARAEVVINVPSGPRSFDFSMRPILDAQGAAVAILSEALDITDRRRAEAQLRQAQKMEAVGQLTGGIAHDFNNLLTGIVGSLELLQRRLGAGTTQGVVRYVDGAMQAALRAASLTQRLLAFARRQPLDPRRLDANRLLSGMVDLLQQTVGPAVRLELELFPALWSTLSDPNQLENAILNLAINARDAMPGGGLLRIETANAELDPASAASIGGDVQPGAYVRICVADTGSGMTPDVASKAFEPFFTTKPTGQGTGLGLSMLYGFIKQSGGHVRLRSDPGQGTVFDLYLPRSLDSVGAEPASAWSGGEHRAGFSKTVLVVEDEATVRMLVVETLAELGFAALEAEDGAAGLSLLQSDVRIDLLVTDVGLPGLNGRQLAEAGRLIRPGMPVLFMTGYAHNAAVGQGYALEAGMEIISKPFALDALAQRMRTMMGIT